MGVWYGCATRSEQNSVETIRFQVREHKGKSYADIPAFYRDSDDELNPSRKGVTISPELWPQFAEGIERLGQKLEAQGLLSEVEDEA